jgi:hypothetical protein
MVKMTILFTQEEREYFTYIEGVLRFNDDCPNEIKISVENKFNEVDEYHRKYEEEAKRYADKIRKIYPNGVKFGIKEIKKEEIKEEDLEDIEED